MNNQDKNRIFSNHVSPLQVCTREALRDSELAMHALGRFLNGDWGESPMVDANNDAVAKRRDGAYLCGKYPGEISVAARLKVVGDKLHAAEIQVATSKEIKGRPVCPEFTAAAK